MKVENDLEIVLRSPTNSGDEVIMLSLDVRFTRTNFVRPNNLSELVMCTARPKAASRPGPGPQKPSRTKL
jgi:hypothetical protein